METKKVFFDVKSGKLVAEDVDDCRVFENQAKLICKEATCELFAPDGTKIVSGFLHGFVYKTGFARVSFLNETRVYTPDGKCLVDKADEVEFYPGCWFSVKKRGVRFLYAPDGSLVKSNINSVEVTADGKFAVVHDEDDYLMLYNQKGILYANGFVDFKGDGELFILFYVDKIIAVDPESFAETELLDHDVKVLRHKKFMGIFPHRSAMLYDSAGHVLLSGYMDYEVYANGMYRGINHLRYLSGTGFGRAKNVLYDADGKQVLTGVIDVIEHDNGCLAVLAGQKCFLYNSKGQLIGSLDEEEALGKCLEENCFTLVENGKETLYLTNRIKVAEEVDEVRVFASGLILVESKNAFFGESLYSLYNAEGCLLCSAADFFAVDGLYGYYLLGNKRDASISVWKDGKEILSGLSDAFCDGRLLCVERAFGEIFVYDLSIGLKEPIWSEISSSDDPITIVRLLNIDRCGKGNNA